jgi:hypothetical protein
MGPIQGRYRYETLYNMGGKYQGRPRSHNLKALLFKQKFVSKIIFITGKQNIF